MAGKRKYKRRSVSVRPHLYERSAIGAKTCETSVSAFVERAINELCDRLGLPLVNVDEALERQAKRSQRPEDGGAEEGIGGIFTF